MVSKSSSMFNHSLEEIGTEFGILYSRSSSSILIPSILFNTVTCTVVRIFLNKRKGRGTDHWNVYTISFNNVDKIVYRGINLMNRHLSSALFFQRPWVLTCALLILYSLITDLIAAGVSSFRGTEFVIRIPPFSFFEMEILGGFLFNLIPKPSNSFVRIAKSTNGFKTSRTMKIRLQVLATAITCLPLPFPSC
jgi:hypothetical protein